GAREPGSDQDKLNQKHAAGPSTLLADPRPELGMPTHCFFCGDPKVASVRIYVLDTSHEAPELDAKFGLCRLCSIAEAIGGQKGKIISELMARAARATNVWCRLIGL